MNRLNWSKRELILGGSAAVFLVLLAISYFHPFSGKNDSNTMAWNDVSTKPVTSPVKKEQTNQSAKPKMIMIDVKGAVKTPGVYQMKDGDRVLNAIQQAGGFLKNADRLQINLAKRLQDEMVVYVPKKGEKVQQIPPGTARIQGSSKSGGKIAINTASETDLEKLPGVGPATAEAIIHYRKQHGPFKKADDLLNVPGIGEKSMQDIQDQITF